MRPWSQRYRKWLDTLRLPQAAQQIVLKEYIHALDEAEARIKRLEAELAELAESSAHAVMIAALQALRGVGLLTAITLVAELGDITRFRSARQLMAYAGLVPSEDSSGPRRRRGGITRTGNAHVRRVIVEAACTTGTPPGFGSSLRQRQNELPPVVTAIAWKAQHRLNLRYRRLVGRGKSKQLAVVAIGRQLLGFIWAVSHAVSDTVSTQAAA